VLFSGAILHGRRVTILPATLVVCLSSWFFASSLWIFPHGLSYFNESIGGPLNGPKHLLGSNVDWGQDLRYLKWWWESNANSAATHSYYLAYFGIYSPADVGLKGMSHWPDNFSKLREYIANVAAERTSPDAYVLSVNLLYGLRHGARSGEPDTTDISDDVLSYFRPKLPVHRIGYSICVFE
jgi:hypothetical protein